MTQETLGGPGGTAPDEIVVPDLSTEELLEANNIVPPTVHEEYQDPNSTMAPIDRTAEPVVEEFPMPEGEANVRLSSKRKDDALPKGPVNIGMTPSIVIPDTEAQLQGFYAPDAAVLVGQFPQYKFVQKKGQQNDQHVKI